MGLFWFKHNCREVKASGIWRICSHYIDNQKAEKPTMLAVAQVPFSNCTMQNANHGMGPLPVGGSSRLSQDNPLQIFLEATVSSILNSAQLMTNSTTMRVWRAEGIALLFFVHHKRIHWKGANYEPERRILARHWISCTLMLYFPASRTMSNTILSFIICLLYGILLQQPKQINTSITPFYRQENWRLDFQSIESMIV